ncbi:MAG: 3-dehydroquinate synthase [Bacteroidetes bacterium]|nr:MAG: 3-dehydroquinate synthase [Bacteroidota bacterium]
MLTYPIHTGERALRQLEQDLRQKQYEQIMVLVDTHTHEHCYPLLRELLPEHELCVIKPGEIYKNLDTCTIIWQKLTQANFGRRSLMLNLGGGVIGDMGGFVAGTYKRGIDFIQLPTTLLSQVDASVGGKLGIDFMEFKNHIGLFLDPQAVYIYPPFLHTLPQRELLSGFAEVIKHHLIANREGWQQLRNTTEVRSLDLKALIEHSIDIKSRIVELDPQEKGARKALNFGHTIGHAIESHYLHSPHPLLHGEAIAIGMVTEAHIAFRRKLLSASELAEIHQFIARFYPKFTIPTQDFDAIFARMANDKKNMLGQILCTLLKGIGTFLINIAISKEEVFAALNYYNHHGPDTGI